MRTISQDSLKAYRDRTFRSSPGLQIKTREEAIAYVKERGFVYFWPITGVLFPSLWTAVAGDRPVADEHDDPGHVTWGWKDGLLGSHEWYYAKVLRKKGTMISFDVVPYFYALSENYGSPEDDYLTLYEQGRLTLESKMIYEELLDEGALDTVALRKNTHMSSRSSEARFEKALSDLQADFKILPVGVADAGSWHYAFVYDIVARRYPELTDQAHEISESEAYRKLADLYFQSVGAARPGDLSKLFGWRPATLERTIDYLEQNGRLECSVSLENQRGEWVALSTLG